MGNTCTYTNRDPIALNLGQFHQNRLQTTEDITQNKQKHDSANPEVLDKQSRQKKLCHKDKKRRQNQQLNHGNYKKLIEQQYQFLIQSYKQHYIDQANQHAVQLQRLIDSAKQKKLNYELSLSQKSNLQKIKMEYNDVIYFESEIDRGGWDLKSDKNGIRISCRRENDGTVGCRIEALSDVPFQILISIMIQVEFYKDFTPFLEVSRQEKEVARNCRLGYTLNKMPFLDKRESFFQGIGYSRLNHPRKQLFLFTRSIHDKQHLQKILQFPVSPNPEYVQLDYKYFVVRYRPIKKSIGLIDIGLNIDAKINYVPTWIMQMVSKDFGQKFFKNIVRISKNFKGSKWEQNVKNNPELFLYFQREVDNYLQKHSLN